MDDSSILQQSYDNQRQSGIKQEPALPPTSGKTFRTSYQLFLTWLLIGALVCGIIFGPVLVMYLKQQPSTTTSTTSTTTSTTSTTTTTTSTTTSTTSTTTSTTSTTTSTTSTTTSTTSTSTSTTSVTMAPLIPSGVIWLWSGSIATVPQGWAVCDGMQGTPDLRNRFILGSGLGAQYSPTQVGGSSSQTATITVQNTILTTAQMPSHSHGGTTGTENIGTIYYDINSNPCTSGPFGTTPARWINTQSYNDCVNCQHSHPIASEGSDQPHTHAADMTPIDITPPFVSLLYIMKL